MRSNLPRHVGMFPRSRGQDTSWLLWQVIDMRFVEWFQIENAWSCLWLTIENWNWWGRVFFSCWQGELRVAEARPHMFLKGNVRWWKVQATLKFQVPHCCSWNWFFISKPSFDVRNLRYWEHKTTNQETTHKAIDHDQIALSSYRKR
jgi:hypothetical protein